MKNLSSKLMLQIGKTNRQHIQVAFALLAVILLVLGAGAPEDTGIGGGLK
jgi:hypothetical protein